jgi:hypothetical protein
MRLAPVLLVVWLIIGAIAGGQRHYYNSSDPPIRTAPEQARSP